MRSFAIKKAGTTLYLLPPVSKLCTHKVTKNQREYTSFHHSALIKIRIEKTILHQHKFLKPSKNSSQTNSKSINATPYLTRNDCRSWRHTKHSTAGTNFAKRSRENPAHPGVSYEYFQPQALRHRSTVALFARCLRWLTLTKP